MASDNIITVNFWKGLVTVATIVGGTLYIEKSNKETIKECLVNMEYRVAMLEKASENTSKSLSELTMSVASCNYRVESHQDILRELLEKKFLKPETELKIESEKEK